MKKRITPDMIVEMVELAKQDVNITEIARRMNLDRTCVHKYLRIHYPDGFILCLTYGITDSF